MAGYLTLKRQKISEDIDRVKMIENGSTSMSIDDMVELNTRVMAEAKKDKADF